MRTARSIVRRIEREMDSALSMSNACVAEIGSAYYDGKYAALSQLLKWIEENK